MRQKKFDTIAVHGLYDMQAALGNQGSIIEPAFMATNLGRVKSVATIPMISTHQQITDKDIAGLQANLIRLSVGLEHPDDIIADLEQALRA